MNIDYAKQHHTTHCWLPAKVMYPANSTKRFSWLTRSTSILLMKNVQIYIIIIALTTKLCSGTGQLNANPHVAGARLSLESEPKGGNDDGVQRLGRRR